MSLYHVRMTDNFDYCGSLIGENPGSAKNTVTVASATRKDRRTPRTLTTGINW